MNLIPSAPDSAGDSVDEVTIDDVVYEDVPQPSPGPALSIPDGGGLAFAPGFAMPAPPEPPASPAPPPAGPGRTPTRHARRGGTRGGASRAGSATRKKKKRQPELSGALALVVLPFRYVAAFVLGSGLTRNNPLIVTLRMLLVLALPTGIAMWMSYYSMGMHLLPSGGSGGASELVGSDASGATVRIGGTELTLPLPAGFSVTDAASFFTSYPLVARAAEEEKARTVFVATSDVPADRGVYATLTVMTDMEDKTFTEPQFVVALKNYATMRDLGSSVQMGRNQLIIPYSRLPLSVCFGRRMGETNLETGVDASLVQYSFMFYRGGKGIVVNAGAATGADGAWDGAAANRCQEVLAKWRERLMN